ELAKRKFKPFVHLAIDGDFPRVSVLGLFRNLPVVANVEFVVRRGRVIKQAFRGFRHQRLLAKHDELVALSREAEIGWTLLCRCSRGCGGALRHGGRNQPARHVGRKRDRTTDGGAHCSKPGPVEKATSAWSRSPPEYKRVRSFGVLAVQFFDGAFFSPCH